MSAVFEGDLVNGEGNDGIEDFADETQRNDDFPPPNLENLLALIQQYELNQQFTRNSGTSGVNFTGPPANRMTTSNFNDLGLQSMFDNLYNMQDPYASPGYVGLLGAPQIPFGVSVVPGLTSLAPSTNTAVTRAGGLPNTGAACLYIPASLSAYAKPRSIDRSLPTPKDAWTGEQEDYLLAAKKNGCTFAVIRAAMNERFGVDRNPNILSKKYRAIMARDIRESVLDRALNNALPDMLGVLEEEMSRLDPGSLDQQQYKEIRQELRKKLPGFVRKLALG